MICTRLMKSVKLSLLRFCRDEHVNIMDRVNRVANTYPADHLHADINLIF